MRLPIFLGFVNMRSFRSGTRGMVHMKSTSLATTDAAWDGSASRFDDTEWARSCVLDRADCGADWKDKTAKERYSLPVREPSGTLNVNGLHAAAGRLGSVKACDAAKKNAASHIAALYKQIGEDPPEGVSAHLSANPLSLSVSVSDVCDEFYEDFATMEDGRYWWWVQMILLDPNELIVNDGFDNLYRMSFTTNDKGLGNPPDVTFGSPVPIRLEPVDTTVDEDADESYPVAARHEAVLAACTGIASVRGREKVAASFESRAETLPEARKKEEVQVKKHIAALRAKLNLAADVPDEKVLELAAARLESDGDGGHVEHEGEGDGKTKPSPAEGTEEDPAKPNNPGETKDITDGNGGTSARALAVDAEAFAQLQADAQAGREARAAQLRAEDEAYVDEAIKVGKIPPRSREATLKRMARSPEARAEEREFLDELAENVVPVSARGGSGGHEGELQPGANGGRTPELAAYFASAFPQEAERNARIAAGAAEGRRVRVHTDGF